VLIIISSRSYRSLGDGKKKLLEGKLHESPHGSQERDRSSQIAGLYLSSGDGGSSRYAQTQRCWDLLLGISEQHPNLRKTLTKEKLTSHGMLAHLSVRSRKSIAACLPRSVRSQMIQLLDNFNADISSIDHDIGSENDTILDRLTWELQAENDSSMMFASLPNMISGIYNAVCNYLDHQAMKSNENKIDVQER
jgi:hypothetical protein